MRSITTKTTAGLVCAVLLGICRLGGIGDALAANSAESPSIMVDTRIGADLVWLSFVGDQTITSETSRLYQLLAHFADYSTMDVSATAAWKIEATVIPQGTVFQGNNLHAGFVTSRQYVTIVATYSHRGITKTERLTIAIEPHFYASFTQNQSYYNTTYWTVDFTAQSGGPNGPALSYAWDLDGDGLFDDDAGIHVSKLLNAGRSYLIGVKALDSQGQEAISRKYIVTATGSWAFWVDKPLQLAEDALNGEFSAFRNVDGTPYVPNASRVDNGLIVLTHGIFSSTDEPWITNLAQAIQTRLSANPPNVCLFDWRGMADPTLFETGGQSSGVDPSGVLNMADFLTIKRNGLTQGQVLADWIRTHIALGNIRSDRPIHLIGHSAGGFVMGECGTILKSTISQVTMLDTPAPVKRHFLEYPAVGFVERYISSRYGKSCNEFMTTGDFNITPKPIIKRIDTSSHYYRGEVENISGSGESDHSYAHEWYRADTISGSVQDGFYYSPFFPDHGFHGTSRASLLAARQSAGVHLMEGSIPDQSLTNFPMFGSVLETNDVYTLTEAEDAGLAKQMTMPIGAQSLKFRFQFTSPGDGDFLAVYWGTNNPVLYVGLDLPLTRDAFLEADVPVSDFAGQSNQLAFVLTSRGETNAVLVLDQIRLSMSDDPDGDGLSTDEELALGTDPLNSDTDRDGLSDGDEVNTYHTNPLLADSDTDGQPDGREITAGTDPTNSMSVFMITDLSVGTNNMIDLQWSGATDRLYRVNYATSLPYEVYTTLINNFPSNRFLASGPSIGVTNSSGYFRIKLDDQQ